MTPLTPQPISQDYAAWLTSLKAQIRNAHVKASLAVNSELIRLYWQIGKQITAQRSSQKWGSKILDQLAMDLRREFPDMQGLSKTNLKYMASFAEAWPEFEIGQQLVDQLPWGQNISIMTKIVGRPTREWYIKKTIENGWSRSVLEMQIESHAHLRLGAAQNNFERTLPAPQSELAREITKDPYAFDFLALTDPTNERIIENALIDHLRRFLVELGVGFAFLGNQYRIEVEGDESFIDLLFYHTKLHCYVVIELKNTDFKPEYTGQLNYYIAAVDDLIRDKVHDAPTIGLLLCKSKKTTKVAYALKGIQTPMGVSTYTTVAGQIPQALESLLPSIETLEKELRVELIKAVDQSKMSV